MRTHPRIHFYIDTQDESARVGGWLPDLEPWRFASGIGHNLYELMRRLQLEGVVITSGPRIPKNTNLVVGFISSFVNSRHSWKMLQYRTVMIRSDSDQSFNAPFEPDHIVTPNGLSYWKDRYGDRAVSIPALPQRGLIGRTGGIDHPRTIVLKCNPGQAPEEIMLESYRAKLENLGYSLVVDMPTKTNGSDQTWHDFSDADLTLCFRASGDSHVLARKPPTKLINAWSAHSVPIITPEPAYLEIAHPGSDCFLATDAVSLLEVLGRIRLDPSLYERALAGSTRKAEQYSSRAILREWLDFFTNSAGKKSALQIATSRLQLLRSVIERRMTRTSI